MNYLNIYLGTKLLFEIKFTQEECIAYSQLSALVTGQHFKTPIGGCLDESIVDVLTDIAKCIRPHDTYK